MTEVPFWWFSNSSRPKTRSMASATCTHEFAEWDHPALVKLPTKDIDALVQQLREREEADRELLDDLPDEPPAVAIAKRGDA
jgi:hypothetical protein